MSDEKNNSDEEPSIEEILSSIRDIISEDDEDGATAEIQAEETSPEQAESLVDKVFAKEAEPEAENAETVEETKEDDDFLELTDIAEEDDVVDIAEDPLAGIDLGHPEEEDLAITEEEPETMDNDAVDDVFDSIDVSEEVAEAEAEIDVFDTITTEEAVAPVITDESAVEEALVDKVAESATVGAMAKLAENIAVSRTSEGVTLEDIVKQSLRPMLKDWLDENLPTLIERLVSQELERLSNKAAGK